MPDSSAKAVERSLALFVVVALPALYVGSALPDWDITLFSIGAHRNPLFHSALPYFFAGYLSRRLGLLTLLHHVGATTLIVPMQIGFALGLGSHLLLDIVQYGDVRWIPGGTLDRLWLALHTGILVLVAWYPQYVSASTPASGVCRCMRYCRSDEGLPPIEPPQGNACVSPAVQRSFLITATSSLGRSIHPTRSVGTPAGTVIRRITAPRA